MKTKKITKKQSDTFNKNVTKIIFDNGFTSSDDCFYDYKKDTHFGVVRISLYECWRSEIYTIFVRFDDPDKAIRIFNCNKFSGKYNFHCNDAQEILEMFEYFISELESRVEVDKAIREAEEFITENS